LIHSICGKLLQQSISFGKFESITPALAHSIQLPAGLSHDFNKINLLHRHSKVNLSEIESLVVFQFLGKS